MIELEHTVGSQGIAKGEERNARASHGLLHLAIFSMIVAVCFVEPLSALVNYAIHSDLYSHIVLIPLIVIYFIWKKGEQASGRGVKNLRALSVVPSGIALVILTTYWTGRYAGSLPSPVDYLTIMSSAVVFLVWSGAFFCLNVATLRAWAFPLALLIFIVPFPELALTQIEHFLQTWSAAVAHLFFQMTGAALIRDGMIFRFPGFSLEVAPQCSGIHSSLVFLITSLVATHLLLRSWFNKVLLVAFVIPLALIRNGLRIFTIGELCLRVSPDMAHAYIHTHGGPIFFLLSMIPFLGLLGLLIRAESRSRKNAT